MVEFQAVTGGGQGLPGNEARTLGGLGGLRRSTCLGTLKPLPL